MCVERDREGGGVSVEVERWGAGGLLFEMEQHTCHLSSFKTKLKTFLFSQYFHPN